MLKSLFIFSFLFIFCTTVYGQRTWKFDGERDGIKIYTSLLGNSKIKAVRAQCSFKAKLSQVVALIVDVEAGVDWVYHTKSSKLIKTVSPSELYYYSEISLPWPLQNRDFVAHLSVSQNPETKIVVIDAPSISGYIEPKKDIIRVKNSSSKWIITPLPNDIIKVECTLLVDPGGNLPVWLINMFATEGPFQIFKKLRTQSQLPAYKNASLAYIVN